MNKKLAVARVCAMLKENGEKKKMISEKERWDHHNKLTRGNPVRIFKGSKFKEIL